MQLMKEIRLNGRQLRYLTSWDDVKFYDHKYSQRLFVNDDIDLNRFYYVLVYREKDCFIELISYDKDSGVEVTRYSGLTFCEPFTAEMYGRLRDFLFEAGGVR